SSTTPPAQPIYFWRPHASNGYLSQWYPSPFTLSGPTEHYATAEMYMMVRKARLFGDESTAQKMLQTADARVHKRLGRRVQGFDDEVWDQHKLDIVAQGNYYKFTVSRDAGRLRGWLMSTGERELVEASPLDRIWGIGFAEKDAGGRREDWGENLLGRVLEGVRGRIRRE
ncbi:hypothetical protein BDU57DRAFT_415526, partial [Ampelomyces quisqualis]